MTHGIRRGRDPCSEGVRVCVKQQKVCDVIRYLSIVHEEFRDLSKMFPGYIHSQMLMISTLSYGINVAHHLSEISEKI